MKKIVIIESPYQGNLERNATYLRRCVLHSIALGETPFASHGFFPLFLDDEVPEERELGIILGHQFIPFASRVLFYVDYEWSPGMLQTRAFLSTAFPDKKIAMRRIGTNESPHLYTLPVPLSVKK